MSVESNISASYKMILSQVYPVGSIYESINNNDPNNFIGGSWVRIGQGRIFIGAKAISSEVKDVSSGLTVTLNESTWSTNPRVSNESKDYKFTYNNTKWSQGDLEDYSPTVKDVSPDLTVTIDEDMWNSSVTDLEAKDYIFTYSDSEWHQSDIESFNSTVIDNTNPNLTITLNQNSWNSLVPSLHTGNYVFSYRNGVWSNEELGSNLKSWVSSKSTGLSINFNESTWNQLYPSFINEDHTFICQEYTRGEDEEEETYYGYYNEDLCILSKNDPLTSMDLLRYGISLSGINAYSLGKSFTISTVKQVNPSDYGISISGTPVENNSFKINVVKELKPLEHYGITLEGTPEDEDTFTINCTPSLDISNYGITVTGTLQDNDEFTISVSSSSYPSGQEGGETNHVLTENEIPSHTHKVGIDDLRFKNGNTIGDTSATGIDYNDSDYKYSTNLASAGKSQAHENMPPYVVYYAWERIS